MLSGYFCCCFPRNFSAVPDAAWLITLLLLLLGSMAQLLNGLEWEQAVLLLLFFFVLLASRDEFYRRSALVAEPFTPGRFLAIGVVLGSALWLGLFSYKQVGYGDELWWHFALYGDASRFLRASVAVAVIALAAAALHLLASATTQSGVAGGNALTRAAEIVAQSPEARANLALLGDKRILFHPAGDGFVMFGIVRRSWVVLGDPIGPFARWRDLLCQLVTEATSQGGWPVFFGVGEAAAKICSKLGFAVRRIGDQAIVPLDQFAIEKLSPELRESHRQIASLGCQFEVVASEAVPALMPELLSISERLAPGQTHQTARLPEHRLACGLPRAISGRRGSITRPHSGVREPCWIGWQSGTLDRARPLHRERADRHLGFRAR